MVYAVFVVFDVAVEHGRVRLESKLVGKPRGFKPFAAIDLVVADDGAHARRKDLRTATGHGVDSRLSQLDQRLLNGELCPTREKRNFNHGEGLDVHLGKALFKTAYQVKEVFEGQVRVQSANDV